jgi:hypothetical protein
MRFGAGNGVRDGYGVGAGVLVDVMVGMGVCVGTGNVGVGAHAAMMNRKQAVIGIIKIENLNIASPKKSKTKCPITNRAFCFLFRALLSFDTADGETADEVLG